MDKQTYAVLKKKNDNVTENIDEVVDSWLEENVDPSTGYVLDSTLSLDNAAPPASAVGDLKTALSSSPIRYGTTTYVKNTNGETIIDGFPVVAGHTYKVYYKSSAKIGKDSQLGVGSNGNVTVSSDDLYDGFTRYLVASTSSDNSRLYITSSSTASGVTIYGYIEDVTVTDPLNKLFIKNPKLTGSKDICYYVSAAESVIETFPVISGHNYKIYAKLLTDTYKTSSYKLNIGLGSNGSVGKTLASLTGGVDVFFAATTSSAISRVYVSFPSATHNQGIDEVPIYCEIEDLTDPYSLVGSLADIPNIYDNTGVGYYGYIKLTEAVNTGLTIFRGFCGDGASSENCFQVYLKSSELINATSIKFGLSNATVTSYRCVSGKDLYQGVTVILTTPSDNKGTEMRLFVDTTGATISNPVYIYAKLFSFVRPHNQISAKRIIDNNSESILNSQNLKYIGTLNPKSDNSGTYSSEPSKHKYFTLGFATDIHGDRVRLDRFKTLMNQSVDGSKYEIFDLAVLGGDLRHYDLSEPDGYSYNNVAECGTWWVDQDTEGFMIPLINVIGNHDVGFTNSTSCLDDTETHDLFFKNTVLANNSHLPYGYYDDSSFGVRVICLYDFDSGLMDLADQYSWNTLPVKRGYAKIYSQEQIDWFASTLNSVPSGYKVIVVTHTSPLYRESALKSCSDFTDSSFTLTNFARESYAAQGYRNSDNGGMGVIADIIQAYINKTTINETYSYTGNNWWGSSLTYWSDIEANYDFSSANGTFGFYLTGHRHKNFALSCTLDGYTDQMVIGADTASMENAQRISSLSKCRLLHTPSQDSILGIIVNKDDNKVSLVSIGADTDTNENEKKYFTISLNNGESKGANDPFIVTLTPTALDYSGTMDKTVAEINTAYEAGRRIFFRLYSSATSYVETDCLMRGRDTSVGDYPSFNGYIIDEINNVLVYAYTGINATSSAQTYSTHIYTLTPMS